MCGINGFSFENKGLLDKMNQATHHRGPDATGTFIEGVSLGHNRLSIIDLSEKGKQPMSNEDGTIQITFNGEIYNFQEIRKELEGKHTFKSHSDTEVIVHAYEEWGQECVKKFNGMWAFCIYDKKKNILFLSRDRFGKKPLFYTVHKGTFIFSSEIKGILQHQIKKELNKTAVSSFLSYRYVLGEETFFKNIYKVLPAHNLIFDLKTKKLTHTEYWDLDLTEAKVSEQEAKKKVSALLQQSIAYRKISDVPLGVILSGGLDSSLITAMLARQEKKPINTFTVKFNEEGFDETIFAKKVAKDAKAHYHEVKIDTSNVLTLMKEYSKHKDEPIGVPNEIALYLLSKKIKEKVTVVLSGEGADEVFEGYGRIFSSVREYELLKSKGNDYKKSLPVLYAKYEGRTFATEEEHFNFLYGYWSEEEQNEIVQGDAKKEWKKFMTPYFTKVKNMPYGQKISYVFLKIHIPGLLARLDASTMASAVEARAPFMDYMLAGYGVNLPSTLKTKWALAQEEYDKGGENTDTLSEIKNTSKYVLKEVAREYLAREIIERKKQGFPLPLQQWFGAHFEKIVKELLLSQKAHIAKVIDQKKLELWMNKNREKKEYGQKVWMLVSLELWLQEWFAQ